MEVGPSTALRKRPDSAATAVGMACTTTNAAVVIASVIICCFVMAGERGWAGFFEVFRMWTIEVVYIGILNGFMKLVTNSWGAEG